MGTHIGERDERAIFAAIEYNWLVVNGPRKRGVLKQMAPARSIPSILEIAYGTPLDFGSSPQVNVVTIRYLVCNEIST
jgi:hypothetical protein